MGLHIHVHNYNHSDKETREALESIHQKLNTIMATQAELAAQLNEVTTQVGKIKTETQATLTKVSELEAALANQDNVSPELQTAFDNLKAQVIAVDELIPDAPVAEPPVEEAQA